MTFPKRENFQKPTNHELIVVGSKNPVKISSTQEGFMQAFDRTFSISGVQASSEVSDQPMGLEETLLGAKNRAKNAKRLFPEADFWVGVEGGVAKDSTGMYAFAWVYILAKNGKTGQAMTGTFYLPQQVMELVESGMELGHADDQIFGDTNSKQKGGSVGLLTKQKMTREDYYTSAIILALIPFLNEGHF